MAFLASAAILVAATLVHSAPVPDVEVGVDTLYPYIGPAIPIADLVDHTVNGNASTPGFKRLWEAPAVMPPSGQTVMNNINVISLSYIPGGMNIHFQTPHGIGGEACVDWGEAPGQLWTNTKGTTTT